MVSKKRDARVLALQALFEIDIVGHDPETVLQSRLEENPLPDELVQYFRRLVLGVIVNRKQLDSIISKYAPAWPINQLPCVDRNILRIALYELGYVPETPVKVAINEAVELAKLFGNNNSYRFINGVLGTVVEKEESFVMGNRKKRKRRKKNEFHGDRPR